MPLHTIIAVMDQYDDVECTLTTCILCDVTKHECDQYDVINRIEICLIARRQPIPVSMFVVSHNIESASIFNKQSRVAEAV